MLGARKTHEFFDVGGVVVNPMYNVFNNPSSEETQNTLCDVTKLECKNKPIRPVQPPPLIQASPPNITSEPAPVCAPEITLDALNDYELNTPEEQAIEDRIAAKQAELNELEKQKTQSFAAYKQQEQATSSAIDQMNSAMNDMKVAMLRQQNADNVPENPIQKMLNSLDQKVTKIEEKLNK
jgi:hypothetical protein